MFNGQVGFLDNAAVLFPPQLTSIEKKKLRAEENGGEPSPGVNGHKKAQRKPKEKAPTLF